MFLLAALIECDSELIACTKQQKAHPHYLKRALSIHPSTTDTDNECFSMHTTASHNLVSSSGPHEAMQAKPPPFQILFLFGGQSRRSIQKDSITFSPFLKAKLTYFTSFSSKLNTHQKVHTDTLQACVVLTHRKEQITKIWLHAR